MENFTAYNPTRLHFGKNVTDKLGDVVKEYGKNVFLIYGQGSVKKYGYYNKIVKQLKDAGLKITEYSGIRPNPVIEDVEKAAALGKKNKVDVMVALGGGSVIDSAKIIGLCIASDTSAWNFMKWRARPEASVPLINVLTLAATGTEMNGAAVIQNPETGEKLGFVHELNFPKHSFLDPQFTISVPFDYTAYGIVDLIAHSLEAFFGKGEPSITDRIIFSIIKDAFYWGPKLLQDLQNYDLRANIMLDATLALNGLTNYGKQGGDWGVHAIGHQLSFLYDTPHGATLSIAYPAWLKLQKNRIPDRIKALGKGLFDT
ncbi:MAG: iron-containing alcohol dehydrogenase, partial [Bacteroidota bacterium]|nr:iron-containing alcohol dehydrogenase [Bacteroidota bacterium]